MVTDEKESVTLSLGGDCGWGDWYCGGKVLTLPEIERTDKEKEKGMFTFDPESRILTQRFVF